MKRFDRRNSPAVKVAAPSVSFYIRPEYSQIRVNKAALRILGLPAEDASHKAHLVSDREVGVGGIELAKDGRSTINVSGGEGRIGATVFCRELGAVAGRYDAEMIDGQLIFSLGTQVDAAPQSLKSK